MSTNVTPSATLSQRHADLTQRLILESAVALLEEKSVPELTVRAAAARANISQRTIFRYFASRDEFLDAVAAEVIRHLDMPPPPASMEELREMPRRLFGSFERKAGLTRAALHSELFDRIRAAPAQQRWRAVSKLVAEHAPQCSEHQRMLAAANIRFHLSASTWNYYRSYFGFSLEDTIECAEIAIAQTLDGLRRRPSSPRGRQGRRVPDRLRP